MNKRPVKDSSVEVTHLVLPSHANAIGNIFGGQLMSWVDLAASYSAMRHSRCISVTASMDELNFIHPIKVGDLVILKASVNFVGKSSMEVGVRVEAEEPLTGKRTLTAHAYLTFVAINNDGKPTPVPRLILETDDEKRRYQEGEERRTVRLARKT
jgi:acyl-CoA hydrolase